MGGPGLVAVVAVLGVVTGGAVAAGSSVAAAGAAAVTCQGQVATIVATEDSQEVTGAGDDHVEGIRGFAYMGPGNDEADLSFARIWGESGNDDLNISIKGLARGGTGNDTVTGTANFEDDFQPRPTWVRTFGGAGADTMPMLNVYAEGDLTCPKACSRGTINGGSGVDTLYFGTRAVVDLATGKARQTDGRARLIRSVERVEGSSEDDVMRGGRRAEVLVGGRGRDVLIGRGGNDRLIGGKGRDRADGGPGRDRCRQVEVSRSC